MVECAFGIVCNKWRIFHCAIDVCPDFCNVIVKTVAYYTTSFVRNGLQFPDTLYEYTLESIKVVGKRGNVTGTDMRRRAKGAAISVRWGAWQGASLRATYV
jgi:hypothetical protein